MAGSAQRCARRRAHRDRHRSCRDGRAPAVVRGQRAARTRSQACGTGRGVRRDHAGGSVMNTTITPTMSPTARPVQASLRAYVLSSKYEFLRVLRTPAFAFPTLLFPPMFYLLFGLLLNRSSN